MSNKAQAVVETTGFLTRLRKDQRGNTLMMVGAAIFPMIAFIGSGMDMSRAYLVKTRMQQACDAGALAGRKAMAGTTLSTTDKETAVNFFRFNFPDGTMATQPLVFDAAATAAARNKITMELDVNKQVGMTATAVMPNMLMQVFGYNEQEIKVTCKAEEYYVNTDIMLVLDTTGSMNCTMTNLSCVTAAVEQTDSRMENLRNSIKTLYTNLRPAQLALEAKSLRMRIGWVNYSTTVNVGKLLYAQDSTSLNNPGVYRNKTGTTGTAYNGPTQSAAWFTATGASDYQGCIVERQTTAFASSTTAIPSAAWDLDIARMPTDVASRWTPIVNTLYLKNNSSAANYAGVDINTNACPKPAVHMTAWASQLAFDTEINKIVKGAGYTYHDIGMIWGTRMIANQGIFGSLNPDIFNAVKVKRTIVLFTDGLANADSDVYGAYGVERYEGRVYATGYSTAAEYEDRHKKRFTLMCNVAKSAPINADVWVIAILPAATPVDATFTTCASNAAQVIKVGNTTELNNAFKAVSDKVGNLRIGS